MHHPWMAKNTAPTLPTAGWRFLLNCIRVSCWYDSYRSSSVTENQYLEKAGSSQQRANLTIEQLSAARQGDRAAINALFERLAPPLQRWARGRLPGWARGMISTVDLVQDALMSTYLALEGDRPGEDLAIHAYVRTALNNRLIDQLRKVQRRPELAEMDRSHESGQASPLEQAMGAEALEAYESALAALSAQEREAVVARIELGLPFADIAGLLGKPSADAARMAVSRALVKLAESMGEHV
jgi:RNA polymerase sigma factor (sigma-70 family)